MAHAVTGINITEAYVRGIIAHEACGNNMKKEETLKMMQNLILSVRDEGQRLFEDRIFREEWQNNLKKLDEGLKILNSCDALWVYDKYGAWHKDQGFPSTVKDLNL